MHACITQSAGEGARIGSRLNVVSTHIHTCTRQDKAELLDYISEDQLADFCGGKMPYTFVPPPEEE